METIIIDDREQDLCDWFTKLNLPYQKQRLDVGDLVCGNVVIELKRKGDFVGSMIDGRLIEQINNMQNNFSKACIVVHGNPFKHVSDMEYSNVLGMMASICARTNVNFIMLPDWQYVVEFCYKFLTKATDGKPFVAAGVKKSELDINTQILTLIQGISITKATALLSSLNGLKSVLQASQTDLTKVKGIGNGLATNIRQFGGLFYDI